MCQRQHPETFNTTYLLVEEVIVVGFDVQSSLGQPDLHAVVKDGPFRGEKFPLGQFTLSDQGHDATSVFELSSKLLQFLDALGVSTTGLPGLAYFTSPEADVGVTIVRLLARLDLLTVSCSALGNRVDDPQEMLAHFGAGRQRLVPSLHSFVLPMLIHFGCKGSSRLAHRLIKLGRPRHLLKADHGSIIDGGEGLPRFRDLLEKVHELFELVDATSFRCRSFLICRLQIRLVITGHAILNADALLYG